MLHMKRKPLTVPLVAVGLPSSVPKMQPYRLNLAPGDLWSSTMKQLQALLDADPRQNNTRIVHTQLDSANIDLCFSAFPTEA